MDASIAELQNGKFYGAVTRGWPNSRCARKGGALGPLGGRAGKPNPQSPANLVVRIPLLPSA